VIIAEHGEYPKNEKGQTLYPCYEFFKRVGETRCARRPLISPSRGRENPVVVPTSVLFLQSQSALRGTATRELRDLTARPIPGELCRAIGESSWPNTVAAW
jgi:hypothetical protein